MNVLTLMVGIVMAGAVFVSLFWSVAQLIQARGALRLAHGANISGILLGAATLSYLWIAAAPYIGVYVTVAGLAAAFFEAGWSRLLPVFAASFGIALILGLPFQGG